MTTRTIARGAKTVRRAFRPRTLSRNSLLFGTALGCSIAIMAAAVPQQAWAVDECGAIVAGSVTCDADGVPATDVNPYPSGITYNPVGTDLTVVVTGAVDVVTATNSGVLVVGDTNFDATIDVATGASFDAYFAGVYAYTDGTGDATVTADTGVTITAGTTGIGVNAAGTGDATVDSGADISVDGDTNPFTAAFGIYAASTGGTVDVTTTGTIDVVTTSDGLAAGVFAYGFAGSFVDSTSTVTVTNEAGTAAGLYSYAVGNSIIGQTGDVTVYGFGNAFGVFAVSDGANAEVTVTGNVDVYAYLGTGIGVIANGDASAETVVVGDVDVYGFAGAVGVASISGAGYADATVTGNVTVSSGIGPAYGVQTDADTDSTVTVTGDITSTAGNATFSGGDAYGVDVTAGGLVDIDVTGNITVAAVDGLAVGIDAYAGDDMTITVDGTIDVTSNGSAWGIFASSTGGADVTIDVGDVVVDSGVDLGAGAGTAGGAGIQAYTGGALATVSVTADNVTTSGDNTEGVQAVATAGYAVVTTETVTTSGLGSEGIIAYGYYGATVDSGTVTTSGDGSTGIYAYSFLGASTVTSDSVTTSGEAAVGIYAYGYAGATVTSTDVSTSGDYSIGIEARSSFDTVTVTSENVSTTGYAAVGILAFGYGGTTVTSESITTTGMYGEGIVALDIAGPVLVDSGTIDTSGDLANGIRAGSYGDVTVIADSVTTSGSGSYGINAYSLTTTYNGALVDVTFGDVVTSGDAALTSTVPVVGPPDYTLYYYGASSHGVVVDGGLGNVSIVGDSVTTSGTGANGIVASGFGDVYINVGSVTTTGDALINFVYTGPGTPYTDYYRGATGIDATVIGGDMTLIVDTVTTSGDYAAGINAAGSAYYDSVATTYTGTVSLQVGNVTTNGDFADAITASNAGGDANILVTGTVETFGEGSDGIIGAALAYYDSLTASVLVGELNIDANEVITHGDDSFGIYALGQGGDVNVVVDSVTTEGDGAIGIYAVAQAYYDSGQLEWVQGDVTVDAGTVTTSGASAIGIYAGASFGDVTVNAASVTTSGDGATGIIGFSGYYYDLILLTPYSGDVTITAGEVSTSGDLADGILAYSVGGNVSVTAGDVSVTGLGSNAITAVTGGFDATTTDDVTVTTTGDIYSAYGYGIEVASAGSASVYVESGSVYGYLAGIHIDSVSGAYIQNYGEISGFDGLAIDVDGAAVEIDNEGIILGRVDLTDNDDLFRNNALFDAYDTSDFGLGTDVLENEGVISVNGSATFVNLETLDNTSGVIDLRDGAANDTLELVDTTFVGGAGSQLHVDIGTTAADMLILSGTGNATGVTEIRATDTTGGQMNFGGIVVVDSASNETGAEFVMDDVQSGFVEFTLVFDAAADDWVIFGLPSEEAFELLTFTAGAQDFWRRSGDAWGARTMEIRDAMVFGDGGARRDGWELWMQTHIGDEEFDNFETYTTGGFTFAEDLSTHSDWRGFQFGFDHLSGDADNYSFWGLTMGFTEQETRFQFDNNSFEIEGWNVGAYGGWNWGGLYLNGLLKGDFYEVDANFRTIPAMIEMDGSTWGAKGEIGYRWDGGGWFFEPHAELAWTSTDIDGFAAAGATVDWDDADSLLGKAGARIGGTFGSGDVVLTPYIGLYAVEEFEGDNSMAFATGGVPLVATDYARDGYGQVDFGFTTQTFYGLEGFMKGEVKFGDEADGWTARMGARWRW